MVLLGEPLCDDEAAGGMTRALQTRSRQSAYCSSRSCSETIRRAGQKPVFTCRTAPSTEPFSRGVAGVQAVAWKA